MTAVSKDLSYHDGLQTSGEGQCWLADQASRADSAMKGKPMKKVTNKKSGGRALDAAQNEIATAPKRKTRGPIQGDAQDSAAARLDIVPEGHDLYVPQRSHANRNGSNGNGHQEIVTQKVSAVPTKKNRLGQGVPVTHAVAAKSAPKRNGRGQGPVITRDRAAASTKKNGRVHVHHDDQNTTDSPAETRKRKGHLYRATQKQSADPLPTNLGGDVQRTVDDLPLSDIPAICLELRELEAQRLGVDRAKGRINKQMLSLVRRCMGWHGSKENTRKKINAESTAILKAYEKSGSVPKKHAKMFAVIEPTIAAFIRSRFPIDNRRKMVRSRMEELAKMLPVWRWVETVYGVGAPALAQIIGETGDLSNYANPGKVWKRLGMSVTQHDGRGYSQGRGWEGIKKNDWVELGHGRNKERRSVSYAALGVNFVRFDQCPYNAVYKARRAYEESRKIECEPKHLKKIIYYRSVRYAEKRFLKHLWQAWRVCNNGVTFTPGTGAEGDTTC